MNGSSLYRKVLIGIALIVSLGIISVAAYINPTHRALDRQRNERLRFVEQLRQQLNAPDTHRWQVYTEGDVDSHLVLICANCAPADYSAIDRQLEQKALALDFTYLRFGNGGSNWTTLNLRLRNLKRIVGVET